MKVTHRTVSFPLVAVMVLALVAISIPKTQAGAPQPAVQKSPAILLQADGSGLPPVRSGGGGKVLIADGSGLPPVRGGGGGFTMLADGSGLPPVRSGGTPKLSVA